MHLKYLLAAVHISFAVALPAPDLNTVDVNPANGTVTDMSRYIPCDKKTLKVCSSLPSLPCHGLQIHLEILQQNLPCVVLRSLPQMLELPRRMCPRPILLGRPLQR